MEIRNVVNNVIGCFGRGTNNLNIQDYQRIGMDLSIALQCVNDAYNLTIQNCSENNQMRSRMKTVKEKTSDMIGVTESWLMEKYSKDLTPAQIGQICRPQITINVSEGGRYIPSIDLANYHPYIGR